MTPGSPISYRSLWGLGLVLATLCAVLFFGCPFAQKHTANRTVKTRYFARVERPTILRTLQPPQKPAAPKPPPATAAILSIPKQCAVCAEPAQRYIHAIQSPFPENRPIYEAPKVVNNLPPAVVYRPAQPAPYDSAYDNVHP